MTYSFASAAGRNMWRRRRAWAKPSLFAALAIFAAGVTVADRALAGEVAGMQRTVVVSSEGSVAARPDIVRISSGVVTEAETARAALADNTTVMTALISNLKAAGIAADDLQTSSFTVSPRYQQRRDGKAPAIDGYRVSNEVHVVLRDMKRVGEILDKLVTLGANEIGGLSFDVSEPEALKDQARKLAFENARHRAKLYAVAGGAELGDVIAISEEVVHPGPRGPMLARAAMSESVPIEAGTQRIEARVTVTWALK